MLRRGGNAVDAAVAAAAALGVTEPFSAGIGGGGFFVFYNARTGKVRTIDGRETAPAAMPNDAFIDPATGDPYNFSPELVTSGVSVGVPGTLRTWKRALKRWGTISLAKALRPATRVAQRGFEVDETFRAQTLQNEVRFKAFTSTRRLYFRGGDAPAVGSIFRNPDHAATYRLIARRGVRPFYRGHLADDIVRAVRRPPKTDSTDLPVPPGFMRASDLARYRTIPRRPTHVRYRGLDVYGMAPVSSGGSTVGEALNILETLRPRRHGRHRRAAPLPRGGRAGLRRPGRLPRRPGVCRRATSRPALGPVCAGAGLPDRPRPRPDPNPDRSRRRHVVRRGLRRRAGRGGAGRGHREHRRRPT